MFDTTLLGLLICPESGGPLHYQANTDELWCLQSKLAYPIKNNIPVMLPQEARPLDNTEITILRKQLSGR